MPRKPRQAPTNVRAWIASLLLTVFGFGFVALFLTTTAPFALAEDPTDSTTGVIEAAAKVTGGCQIWGVDPCTGAADFVQVLGEKILGPAMKASLIMAAVNITNFVAERLAYESALWIATRGAGGTELYHNKGFGELAKSIGKEVAGEAAGNLTNVLNDGLGIEFDVCSPPNPLIRLSLQLSIKGAGPPKPRCDFDRIVSNWEGFVVAAANSGDPTKTVLQQLGEGLRPGRNELSASIQLNIKLRDKQEKEKAAAEKDRTEGEGFKAVKDAITGKIKTPSTVLKDDFKKKIEAGQTDGSKNTFAAIVQNTDIWPMIGLNAVNVFTNTLLSTLYTRIYNGIFTPAQDPDPLDFEFVELPDTDQVGRTLAGIVTTSPITISNYNIIGEFAVCPVGPNLRRQSNNCVMDANLLNAIYKQLTVEEAVREGFIDPSFALFPSSDVSKNQDPFCYSYGFCYGNLVKLRKARVLPVGWELAAEKNTGATPATLGQIMDAFNDCPGPWCHLIDPNWVLKYPETQCRAYVNGEQLLGDFTAGRASTCVDTPSCIAEGSNGECIGGYGYCTREKNVWDFKGDDCPTQYASCLSFTNTSSNERQGYLLNTVDFGPCNVDNAGCFWYRTNKYLDDQNTAVTSDDTYEWLVDNYYVDFWDQGIATRGAVPSLTPMWAYQDRRYFTHKVEGCSNSAAGCSRVYRVGTSLRLNVIPNPDFEADADADAVADGWAHTQGVFSTDTFSGVNSLEYGATSGTLSRDSLPVEPGLFYTLSFYVKGVAATGGMTATIKLVDGGGSPINTAGTSYTATKCSQNTDGYTVTMTGPLDTTAFRRFDCTFTTPSNTRFGIIDFTGIRNVLIDGIQLEAGENASAFTDGYNTTTPNAKYLKLPPDYLGCTGAQTDAPECEQYAQVCSAQDVGCNLYTPRDGDPAVPAVISDLDRCPNECVGYTTFKQEKTRYETEKFPLRFIANTAQVCSQEYVGCDAFTNLNTIAQGGEGIEYYTDLRACVTPDDTIPARTKTFFTWEGSDASGYSLKTWQLLLTNGPGVISYAQAGVASDNAANLAPCTTWQMDSDTSLVCLDGTSAAITRLQQDDECNEHIDIFDNPDCREFYDESGNIHYRRFSETVTVSDSCSLYRKTETEQIDCTNSGGFFDPATGQCRYFGLAQESASCPASANGCRAYTGGAGRNSVTVLDENFEQGAFSDFQAVGTTPQISNESVATDGSSLRIPSASTGNGVQTKYDGTVNPPEGPLVGDLVRGKTYILEFWAKGSGPINVDFVEEKGTGVSHAFNTNGALPLDGTWRLFSLGPLDTTASPAFDRFDDSAVVRFSAAQANVEFFLDNIRLKQVEENITLIKDSWVTPSTCDTDPAGNPQPFYYLGCEAYTDQHGTDENLYQFTRVCSEDVVGCEAFFDTQNSDSAYQQVYNARCVSPTGTVTALTACHAFGTAESVCTITPGHDSCFFDTDRSIVDLSGSVIRTPLYRDIQLGPEAVIVPADRPMYLVDNGRADCDASNMACTEFGVPTFSADKQTVTGFESASFFDRPDDYASGILCKHDELFCEEWQTTSRGNFYFRNPIDQTCQWKTGIVVNGVESYGWFRQENGADVPCYDGYQVNGDQYGVYRNGDIAYTGWVGQCPQSEDMCTAFVDTVDTSEGAYPSGTPYYYIDNEALSDNALTASERCDGLVSQRRGCTVMFDSSETSLRYNASASYVVSNRADVLFGEDRFSLQDPVSCPNGGVIDIGSFQYDLCSNRCRYQVGSARLVGAIAEDSSDPNYQYTGSCFDNEDCPALLDSFGRNVQGTCESVSAIPSDSGLSLRNDSNRVLKVDRNRECAQWLSCLSTQSVWDPQTGSFIEQCEKVGLCEQYSSGSDTSFCTKWTQSEPIPLTAGNYASRDTSWSGLEYSGYSIGNQLPIDHYDQVDLNPQQYCVSAAGDTIHDAAGLSIQCADDAGCPYGTCGGKDDDYRLVHIAGSCNTNQVGRGGACTTGVCADTGFICGSDEECGTGVECVIGRCQQISNTTCITDNDCTSTAGYPYCDRNQGACVDLLTTDPAAQSCGSNSVCGTSSNPNVRSVCTLSPKAKQGICVDDQCLTNIRVTTGSQVTALNPNSAEAASCRGFPEARSPFSEKVVTEWSTVKKDTPLSANKFSIATDRGQDLSENSTPSAYVNGFQGAATCAPIQVNGKWEKTDDCLCQYQKLDFKTGAPPAFYPQEYPGDKIEGVCVGGESNGYACKQDSDCDVGTGQDRRPGTCAKVKTRSNFFGWEGLCLEDDTSVNIDGQRNNPACLTWFPTDRIKGATDLYAKFTQAGYEPQDTFYCADVAITYTVKTSGTTSGRSRFACAETMQATCNDNPVDDKFFNVSNGGEDCWNNVECPGGFFAVMSGCGDGAPMQGNGHMCTEGLGSDNDCPYICVPKFSFHSADSTSQRSSSSTLSQEWSTGAPCLAPDQQPLNGYSAPITGAKKKSRNSGVSELFIYAVPGAEFLKALDYYQDCEVRGLTEAQVKNYFFGMNTLVDSDPLRLIEPKFDDPPGFGDGYRDLYLNPVPHLTCDSLVQVSDEALSIGSAAWTQRVWELPTRGTHVIIDSVPLFRYDRDLAQAVFGKALDLEAYTVTNYFLGESGPENVIACSLQTSLASVSGLHLNVLSAIIEKLPNTGDQCADHVVSTDPLFTLDYELDSQPPANQQLYARPYLDASIVYYRSATQGVCANDCRDSDECNSFYRCNTTNHRCETFGGAPASPKDGSSCVSDTDCEWLNCRGGNTCGFAEEYLCDSNADCAQLPFSPPCVNSGRVDDDNNAIFVCQDVSDVARNPNVGNVCESGSTDSDCGIWQICSLGNSGTPAVYAFESTETAQDAVERLSQIFAVSLNIYTWNPGTMHSVKLTQAPETISIWNLSKEEQGTYELGDLSASAPWNWDVRASGDQGNVEIPAPARQAPRPPKVVSVGVCDDEDGICKEGDEGKITVNGNDSGVISGRTGRKQARVEFFTYASSEQLPIKNIIVDWGDGKIPGSSRGNLQWIPNQVGSTADDNFYTNYRGRDSRGNEICTDDAINTPSREDHPVSCQSGQVEFVHDYVCTKAMVQLMSTKGRTCALNPDGTLQNAPCTGGSGIVGSVGSCVFQPRVSVKDNWGWCTGTCDSNPADNSPGCYDGGSSANECEWDVCPGGTSCIDNPIIGLGGTSDPWVYFDGYVVVEPVF